MERESNFAFGEVMKNRSKDFALRTIRLFQALPKSAEAQIMGKQVLRSATSVAANYRARSGAEFVAKIGIALEEADETQFWLELLEESGIVASNRIVDLKKEAGELTAILTSIRKSASKKKN